MAEKDVESGQGPSKVSHWKMVIDQGLITPEVLKVRYSAAMHNRQTDTC